MSNRDLRPTTWTPASGAVSLVAEFGEEPALELLTRLLDGGVEPTEFGHEPWARVIGHIGNHISTATSAAVASHATPLDLNSPANAY